MESQLSDQDNSNPNVFEDRTENQIGMSILDLNEHCLLQVFRFLDVYDAIQLGETCKLLHKVLKLAMTKYKKFVVTRYEGYNFMRMLERFQQTLPLEKVLSYVAPHIESLDARTSIYQADNFAMIGHSKNTVRSLELRGVYLSSDDPIYKTLASMDLISLTIAPSYTSNFVSGLTQASFLTLKHLNISHPASIDDIILIIKRFTSLEQLVLVMLLKLYDANELSPRLSELLKVTPTTRPDMELKVLKPSASVKVNKFKIFFFRNLRLIFKLQFSDLLSSWQLRIYKLASVLQWLPTISFRLRIKIIYLRTYPRRCIIYF